MDVVKVHYNYKIYHDAFFGQYRVLLPKGNGNSEMHKFDSIEEAESFIEENLPSMWWRRDE